jgi:hypothetical protein
MGHYISGIITSFKYQGDLPYLYLIGNYAFIPLTSNRDGFKGYAVEPFGHFNPAIKKLIKDLSFAGACAFIETDFHGGDGSQIAIVYQHGKIVLGPLVSSHNSTSNSMPIEAGILPLIDGAVNRALRLMGICRHLGKDEFDTARLGFFRTNRDVLDEIQIDTSS